MTDRHPFACIVPPHMLESIAENGSPEQREAARHTLRLSGALVGGRSEPTPPPVVPEALSQALTPTATVTIYTAGNRTALPGTVARTQHGPGGSDVAVDEAFDGLTATLRLYGGEFDRDSIDGRGMDLVGTVHYARDYDNAFWNGSQMVFGDGDGTLFNRFTIAVDVMGHELTHGVTQYSGGLDDGDQPGALNESVSDVFGSMVKQFHASPQQTSDEADWLIGAGLLASGVHGVALRSLKAPGTAYDDPVLGTDPQPADMTGFVEGGDPHVNSGIPNRAFYLAAVGLGGYSWERAGQVWYEVLTAADRPTGLTFADFAQRTVDAAVKAFGDDAARVVADAWQQVGIETTLPAA
ncbi:M4 family metallopeptidase [Cellulomonas alba]|uniref:Neutral metalloproteinase n=1 Tax=Cellulomonas alba TaxID=3053467 RepID=A0ABT7SLN5_9CELL|nr:M4 family metallopeptidase [Cellulomonas alba]MDM7856472.1 M4 family metallopeptidase [Cellulomonas alba]